MIHINIIGAGRLGQTLLLLLEPLENYNVKAICSSHFKSDTATVVSSIKELPAADLFFVTVPDDHIEKTAAELCKHHRNTTLVHCSGALSSSVLNPDNRADIQVVSVHPPISIVNPEIAAEKFAGGLCTIEGDEAAAEKLTKLLHLFGSDLQRIDPEKKAAYHAANAIAANYLVTLAEAACQQLEYSGMDRAFAKRVVEQLGQSVLDNLKSKDDYRDALTGPIVRGDQDVLREHLACMKPALKKLYGDLGKQTVSLTNHSKKDKLALLSLLSD